MRSTIGAERMGAEKPEMDETLIQIALGFQFLSEERTLAIGMSGGVPMAIPLQSMLLYYNVFKPTVSISHFAKVIRAADNKYLNLHAEKQNTKHKKSSPSTSSSTFPKL